MRQLLPVVALLLGLAACRPRPPVFPPSGAAEGFVAAVTSEARTSTAMSPYLGVLAAAARQPDDPWALAATAAALDALLWREVPFVSALPGGVAHRLPSGLPTLSRTLRRLHVEARTGPMRGLYALALHDLALRVGALKAAHTYRDLSGCPRQVAVAGPTQWPALGSLGAKTPLPAAAPFPAALGGPPPFSTTASFERIDTDACRIDVDATSPLHGQRVVAIDVEVPEPQAIYVMVSSTAAVVAELQGRRLLSRPFEAGGGSVTRWARAEVEAGVARLVLRVGQRGDARGLALHLWDAQGEPLRMHAPRTGERAEAEVKQVTPLAIVPSGTDNPGLRAAALLAMGETRRAWTRLEGAEDRTLAIDLLRLRAVAGSGLPSSQRLLEADAIARRIGDSCPGCWEGVIARAAIARRRGTGDGAFSALRSLGVSPSSLDPAPGPTDPMRLAYVALVAHEAGVGDVARRAYDALRRRAPSTPLVADLDEAILDRLGPDEVKAACDGGAHRASARCFYAHLRAGAAGPAFKELRRLRELRGSLSLLRAEEVVQRLAYGDVDGALRVYAAMLPARRSLDVLGLYLGRDEAKGRALLREGLMGGVGKGAPRFFEPLARLLGEVDDPSLRFAREGESLVAADRAEAFLPGAGTAVLRRHETYHLEATGLLRYTLYDLRRVSDTIDVASGTWMGQPLLSGRQTSRILLRRIHKPDGRVLDPDPSARGQQGNTDLSQLQAGDYVEVLLVGWALPDDAGQLVLDTPDLLPPRTSLREATLVFSRPPELELSTWQHPRLGAGTTTTAGGRQTTTWRLEDQRPRRIEDGVPPLEARVGLSVGTDDWRRIARALAEQFRALDETKPYMKRWAEEAAGDAASPRDRLRRVVAAVGKALPRSDRGALSDFVASLGQGPQRRTARWFLSREDGSRTWVVHRALRALGIDSRIAVAETRPFSAAPGFPARPGRFTHPLVMVRLGDETLFIDADVQGPPLPPGRVSPRLRGRQALLADGTMITIPATGDRDADEIDLRLTLSANGDAQGELTALLQGRVAQRLADAVEELAGADRVQLLRDVVLGWVPGADVREAKLSAQPGTGQVTVRARVTLVGYLQPEGQPGRLAIPGLAPLHQVHPRPYVDTIGNRYAGQADRTTALGIDRPHFYHLRRTITLPPGAEVRRSPGNLVVQTPHLSAQRTFARRGDRIEEHFRLDLPVGTVPAEDYGEFARDARQVDDGFRFGVGLELTKP